MGGRRECVKAYERIQGITGPKASFTINITDVLNDVGEQTREEEWC